MQNEEDIDSLSGSRRNAKKRILKEYKSSGNLPNEILELSPVDLGGDLHHWKAKIKGPAETPYEHGIFKIDIFFTDNYPFKPPIIRFQTKIFHPNINSRGNICLDILYEKFSPTLTLEKTLLSICALLAEPNTDDFLVPEAAYLYKGKRDEYNKIAKEWTKIYATRDNQTTEANANPNGYDELVASMSTMTLLESPDILSNNKNRIERFIVDRSLQKKTFDYGESKEYVPIIAQCFGYSNDDQQRKRTQMDNLDSRIAEQCIYQEFDWMTLGSERQEELNRTSVIFERDEKTDENQRETQKLNRDLGEIAVLHQSIAVGCNEVEKRCLNMYTRNTFFHYDLHRFLLEQDQSKINKYRPYVRLLYLSFIHPSTKEIHGIEVYRGSDLTKRMITAYRSAQKNRTTFRWLSFISTTRNLEFAKKFDANTLYIIQLKKIYAREKKAIDISVYSDFPSEQEILLKPGVKFTTEKVISNKEDTKYSIYLSAYV